MTTECLLCCTGTGNDSQAVIKLQWWNSLLHKSEDKYHKMLPQILSRIWTHTHTHTWTDGRTDRYKGSIQMCTTQHNKRTIWFLSCYCKYLACSHLATCKDYTVLLYLAGKGLPNNKLDNWHVHVYPEHKLTFKHEHILSTHDPTQNTTRIMTNFVCQKLSSSRNWAHTHNFYLNLVIHFRQRNNEKRCKPASPESWQILPSIKSQCYYAFQLI